MYNFGQMLKKFNPFPWLGRAKREEGAWNVQLQRENDPASRALIEQQIERAAADLILKNAAAARPIDALGSGVLQTGATPAQVQAMAQAGLVDQITVGKYQQMQAKMAMRQQDQAMRQRDWKRHQFGRFGAGISKHHSLVAGTLFHWLRPFHSLINIC